MGEEVTKPQKRAIRELLGDAHEAEMAAALVGIEYAIREWRAGQILPSEVNERIHEYHKEAQQIFKTYNYLDPMLALARAVVYGFIALERVPEDLQVPVQEFMKLVRPNGG